MPHLPAANLSFSRGAALLALCMLPACASAGRNFDSAAADRVTIGMSEEEVIALLGQPQHTQVDQQGGRWLSWVHSRASVFSSSTKQFLVHIANGKVATINKQSM
jgi:hypothetical protein